MVASFLSVLLILKFRNRAGPLVQACNLSYLGLGIRISILRHALGYRKVQSQPR